MELVDVEGGRPLRHQDQCVGTALGRGADLAGLLIVGVQLSLEAVQFGEPLLAADRRQQTVDVHQPGKGLGGTQPAPGVTLLRALLLTVGIVLAGPVPKHPS